MEKEDLIYTVEHTTRESANKNILETAPPVVYKYRTWADTYHQDCLLIPNIYFSHPKGLNDPDDIHVPIEFNVEEINDDRFFDKVKEVVSIEFPRLIPGTPPFMAECVDLMSRIRKDPQGYFQKNYADLWESNTYDCYGVFSTAKNGLSKSLWAYYGKDHTGFCIGYAPVDIMNYVVCSMGVASYRDKPVKHSFLEPRGPKDMINDFVKGRQWEHEDEFRFVTLMIQNDNDRAVPIPRSFIKEVIVGYKISDDHLAQIKKALRIFYQGKVPLYQVKNEPGGFRFDKKDLAY